MSAHSQSSGLRGNAYSESKFTHWTALADFADQYLRGMKVNHPFDPFPTEAELDAAAAAEFELHPSK